MEHISTETVVPMEHFVIHPWFDWLSWSICMIVGTMSLLVIGSMYIKKFVDQQRKTMGKKEEEMKGTLLGLVNGIGGMNKNMVGGRTASRMRARKSGGKDPVPPDFSDMLGTIGSLIQQVGKQ